MHLTVASLRPPSASAEGLDAAVETWCRVLDLAAASVNWPKAAFRVRFEALTFEGSTAILRVVDVDGAVSAMRRASAAHEREFIHSFSL